MKRIFLFVCVLFSVHSFAKVIQVPKQFATIQSALNACTTGDTVLADAGIYFENIVWPQTNNIHLLSRRLDATSAIIDGSNSGRVFDIEWTGRTAFIAEINGFTIENGYINVPAHLGERGAGIYVSQAAVQVKNCVLTNNNITSSFAIQNNGGGAAIYIMSSPLTLTNVIDHCLIKANSVSEVTTGEGAAIGMESSNTIISNSTISNNSCSVDEVAVGTVYVYNASLKMDAVKIENNTINTTSQILYGAASIKGGAIYSYESKLNMTNCLADENLLTPFSTNEALLGNAVYFYGAAKDLKIINSTFANNKRTDGAAVLGTALFFNSSFGTAPNIYNSIFWNPDNGDEIYNITKAAQVSFADIRGGYAGTSVINSDPQFIAANNYHLQNSSPCINAGDNAYAPATDLDGNTRPQGGNTDLGCYESTVAFSSAAVNSAAKENIISITKAYPNPTAGIFTLTVDAKWLQANMQLYDAAGKIVFTEKITNTISHFNFSKLAAGAYFIHITNTAQEKQTLQLLIKK